MTAALYIAGGLLVGALAFASYLVQMYNEALSLRKRRDKGAFAFFQSNVQPRLGCTAEEGKTKYTLVQFGILVVLSMNLLYLSSQRAIVGIAVAEALALALLAVLGGAQVVPTVLALRTKGRWAARLVWVGRLLGWCAAPLVLLGGFAASVASAGGGSAAKDHAQKPGEDIDALLDAGQKEGLIDGEDRKLIHQVVGFGDKTVREVMTPRPQIVSIAAESSLEDVRSLIRKKDLSRIPVYSDSIDDVVGFILSRDTLEYGKDELAATTARSAARPITLVPETKRIQELMREMQDARAQIAMVIDEYGQTAGLVTMEDMMEEIVGEIEDETDPAVDVQIQSDESLIAVGGLDVDRLEELVGYRPNEDFESTTIGGLVCEHLGQVPAPGAKLRLDGLEVEVLASNGRQVSKVQLRRLSSPAAQGAEA